MKLIISFLLRHIPRKILQRISKIGLYLIQWWYIGSNVECPICQRHYRCFLPYGRVYPRSNALCPSCMSLERHRLLYMFLHRCTNFFSQRQSVLHIAPESCFIKKFSLQHNDQYVTADLESPLASVKMDIHHMPFNDDQFDVVLCNHVLEHVENDIEAAREIYRVLKPNGWVILQVPFYKPIPNQTLEDATITSPREREKVFGQDDHVRKYGKDYVQRIALSGLAVHADFFVQSLMEEEKKRYCIDREEIIYMGVKKAV